MELNTTIKRGIFSINAKASQCYGSDYHTCTLTIVSKDEPFAESTAYICLDQDERDALVAALQSIPRGNPE